MNKAYDPVLWKNYPSDDTPLNEKNLLRMGNAINIIDNRVVEMDTTKLDKTTALDMVKRIAFNETTGVFTITYLNGSTATIDTKMEKLAVNFTYDSASQQLVIMLDDGTKQYVDMKALVTQYEFVDSNTLAFSVDSDGNITATIKKGSVTADMLQPNFLADVTAQADIAVQKAETAAGYAYESLTQANRAESEADRAAMYSGITAPGFYVDLDTMSIYMKTGVGVEFIVTDNNELCWKIA